MMVPFLVGILLGLVLLVKKLFKTNVKVRNIVKKVENKLFFSAPLRTSLVSYLSFCVSADYGGLFTWGENKK